MPIIGPFSYILLKILGYLVGITVKKDPGRAEGFSVLRLHVLSLSMWVFLWVFLLSEAVHWACMCH